MEGNSRNENILVTGGAGFIGSNFIRYMLKNYQNCRLINLDKLTYAGNLENLEEIEGDNRYCFHRGDICDAKLLTEIFSKEKITCVVNFAAESHVDRSISEPNIFIKTNIVGTHTLLEVFKGAFETLKAKKNSKFTNMTFLQVSTDEVYGSLKFGGFFEETSPISPSSPYSASKASADLIVMSYHKTFGLPVLITRCSNNYGPYQFPEKLIPLMVINTLKNKTLPVYGDGKNIRDWLHVEDHCEAISKVLFRGTKGEVYNIGGNNEKENIEVVNLILSLLKRPTSLIRFVDDRLGHDRRYAINSSKIQKELGWKTRYDVEQGIAKTVKWYCNNKSWWNNILSGEYKRYYTGQYGNFE